MVQAMFVGTVLLNISRTLTKRKTVQTTDLSFRQEGTPDHHKTTTAMKDKEIWSRVRKAGHRDLSTSKIPRYVLARLCGIPTLQTANVNNRQSCSQLSERTGCEGRGMRSSGYGRAALPATWCIPEEVIDDHMPAVPVSALHGTLHQPLIT
jgi:hypothetical protein